MKNIIFNPFLKQFKNPVGAIQNSDEILITIKIVIEYQIYQLRLIIKNDNNDLYKTLVLEKVTNDAHYNHYQIKLKIDEVGLYWYYFEFDDYYGTHYIGANSNLDGVLTDYYPISWQLLIHYPYLSELNWYKGKVMYQIMVDRFYNDGSIQPKKGIIFHENWNEDPLYEVDGKVLNNDFFGGNIPGIIKKLDYLKSLNVSIIYLNPIFESPSNHKYDTADYMKIDPMFGTEEDFALLCEEAKKRGMNIILDGVFNHTGADSIYFNKYNNYQELGAYQSKASKYYDWFQFRKFPDDYNCWWGFKIMPNVNQNNQQFLKFITGKYGVIDKWLTKGAKGFRLDVVDELNDNFLNLIHQRLKSNNIENILIGEVWEDASIKTSYGSRRHYLNGKQLDSVMNYPLKVAIIDYLKNQNLLGLIHQIRHLINNYPKKVLDCLMNHLGTHDTVRLLSNFANVSVDSLTKEEQSKYKMDESEYKNAVLKLKMASAIQYTLPGVPSLYYGDEVGMEGFKDPFCRKTMKWEQIDEEIFNWYQILGEIRKEEVYIDGEYHEEFTENNIFAFSRIKGNTKITTIVNNNHHDITYYVKTGLDLIEKRVVSGKINIPKQSAKIIKES